MDIPLHYFEEKLDHGDRLRSLAAVLEQVTGSQGRTHLVKVFSNELAQVEREHVLTQCALNSLMFSYYRESVEQRYADRKIFRILSLSLSAGSDRDKAAAGARQEIANFLEQMRLVQQNQVREAALVRMRLLQVLSPDDRELQGLADRLLKAMAPEDYEFLSASLARIDHDPASPEGAT